MKARWRGTAGRQKREKRKKNRVNREMTEFRGPNGPKFSWKIVFPVQPIDRAANQILMLAVVT